MMKQKSRFKNLEISVIGPRMADISASAPKMPYRSISSFQRFLYDQFYACFSASTWYSLFHVIQSFAFELLALLNVSSFPIENGQSEMSRNKHE